MKKRLFSLLLVSVLVFTLTSCGEKSLLRETDPVTLNFWHVYGEQSGSPMDLLVQEFNRTVGQEKGVRVQVTNLSSASKIGGFLKEAQKGGRDAPEMPDLFTCHISDATALGSDNLVDWNARFTAEELSNFVPGFLADGMTEDGTLLLFPISKSAQLLMCNGRAASPAFLRPPASVTQTFPHGRAFTMLPESSMTGPAARPSAHWTIPSVL